MHGYHIEKGTNPIAMSIIRLPIKACIIRDLILLAIHYFFIGYMYSNNCVTIYLLNYFG
jgi:hypothetical protein